MKWGASEMAIWLLAVPCMVLFFWWAGRLREKAVRVFVSKQAEPEIASDHSHVRARVKRAMVTTAVFFTILALMRPQYGFRWREVKRLGLDILIALDTSNSMLAEDVLPNRLERAKLAIRDLVGKLEGDRIGLVVFSGTAFLQCPLTIDYNGFLLTLRDVDASSIPVGGTSLSNAIYTALSSYEGGKNKYKTLIIITDGEDLEGGVDRAIQKARAENVMISCVGIGSAEGDIIPLTDARGQKVFLKDSEGNVVKTRLNEETLQDIAVSTGGMYVHSTGAEFGLDLIYDEKLSGLEKEDLKSRMEKHYNERFQIPLGIALMLLLVEPLIGDKKKKHRKNIL